MKIKVFSAITILLISNLACGVLTKPDGTSTPNAPEVYESSTLRSPGGNDSTSEQSGTYLFKLYNWYEAENIPLAFGTATPGWKYYRAMLSITNPTNTLLAFGGDAFPTILFEPSDAAGDTGNGMPFAGGLGAYVETDSNINYPADFLGVQFDYVNYRIQDVQKIIGFGLVTRLIPAHYEAVSWMMVSSSIFGTYEYPGWVEVFFAVPQAMRPTRLVINGQPALSLQDVPSWTDNHRGVDTTNAGYQTLPATIQVGSRLEATIEPFKLMTSNSTSYRGILSGQIIFSNLDQTTNQEIPSPYSATSVFDLADSYGSITSPFATTYAWNQDCPAWPTVVGPGQQIAVTICWGVGGSGSPFLMPNDPLHPVTGNGDKISYILSVILGTFQGSFLGTTDTIK